MTWNEIEGWISEINKWLAPQDVLTNIGSYLTTAEPFVAAEIERKVKQFKAHPNYENLTDDCLKDMARAEVERQIESYGQIYILLASVINVLCDLMERLGYVTGRFKNAQAIGGQKANIERPANLPDISTLIFGAFKGAFDSGTEENAFMRQGFTSEVYNMIKNAHRPLLDVATIAALWHRQHIGIDDAVEMLKQQGFTEDNAQGFLKTTIALYSPTEIRAMYLRGMIDEGEHDSLLSEHGLTDTAISRVKELYKEIPPVVDIIRMAVREAWDEGAIKLAGLDQELPKEAAEWGEKMGLTSEWFRKYWIAHWVIPPVNMGYEMMHRGVINQDELNILMRALDIAPAWRERLMKISYAPYTRVDVRRMFKEGVVTEEQVKRTYLDLGYDDEHADNLTRWTIKDAMAEMRGLSKSQVLDLYTRRLIDSDTAIEWLMDLGYIEEFATIFVQNAEYDRQKGIKDRWIKLCKSLYLKDLYDDNKVIDKLASINMLAEEVTELLDQWKLEKEELTQTLSWGQLRKLIEKQLITKDEFYKYMRKLRYGDEDIELLFRLQGVAVTPEAE